MTIFNSRDFFKRTIKHPEEFYVIHYSCQNLFDDNESLSPRITSIAVTHYATEQTTSFSTHAIAEELGIERENVMAEFNQIESALLQRFYDFVRDRRDKIWVHWNMRNLTYGFEHLEHRFRVLGNGDATAIPVERRLNLNDMLAQKYGKQYANHPKLLSLMELNGGRHRHLLTGAEEVEAFNESNFIRMHNSTLAKVGFFSAVIQKASKGKLKTSSKGFGVMLDKTFESRAAKFIGLLSALISLGVLFKGMPSLIGNFF